MDDAESIALPADLTKNARLQEQFRTETGATYELYLFARRQDQDELAYFVVSPSGEIEDNVISVHLAFSQGLAWGAKPGTPPPRGAERMTFLQWVKEIAVRDVEDWIALGDD